MERWRQVTCWRDYVAIWRGMSATPKMYPLTAERRRRLEWVLAGGIALADGQDSWLWSWNDWNWRETR